mgnify:CR=1 FL=1
MAKKDNKDKEKFIKRIRNKYRLVILNDDTFEEKLSLKLSRLNVFVIIGFVSIFLIVATTILIAFTPLREYIPGYSSTKLRQQAIALEQKSDSLETQVTYYDRYMLNIRNIIEGKPPVNFTDSIISDSIIKAELDKSISPHDSILREFVEEEERFNLSPVQSERNTERAFTFFTPIKGLVTERFDATQKHYGIDVVGNKNEIVKACQRGTVVFAEWTAETGHVIMIQHGNEFISVYKHNSSLIKKQGENVRAGEPIAVIGNSGELSSGPHLHFELWYNGTPVDPESFIDF